jgi:hypothetical protein
MAKRARVTIAESLLKDIPQGRNWGWRYLLTGDEFGSFMPLIMNECGFLSSSITISPRPIILIPKVMVLIF